jgi:nucleoside-diphosphate-sugar epimerase
LKILLTGSTGFLGKSLINELQNQHEILVIGKSDKGGLTHDITKKIPFLPLVEMVVHAAGKAHSSLRSEDEAQMFFKVNTLGTQNLIDALQKNLPKTFVFISTVAIYGLDSGNKIIESSPLLGKSPYAQSKIKAEKHLLEWGKKFNVKILILRLPLVVGSNPPGNLGKMINGIKRGTYFTIGGGCARKSMVLAEDVAKLIAKCPDVSGIYNLTDGYHPCFAELESMICKQLKKPKPLNMPLGLARILGKFGDFIPKFPMNSNTINKITQDLTFSDLKARQELGWNPSRVIDKWKI